MEISSEMDSCLDSCGSLLLLLQSPEFFKIPKRDQRLRFGDAEPAVLLLFPVGASAPFGGSNCGDIMGHLLGLGAMIEPWHPGFFLRWP